MSKWLIVAIPALCGAGLPNRLTSGPKLRDEAPPVLTPLGRSWRIRTRGLLAAVPVPTMLSCLALVGCGVPVDLDDDLLEPAAPATSSSGTTAPTTRVGSDELLKVTMNITNKSNLTWDVTSTDLGHDGFGSGWDQRPVSLPPNQSETVSAYSAFNGQGIQLNMKAREAPQLTIVLAAQDPGAGKNNTNGTRGKTPIVVDASIGSGLQCTATFTITGTFNGPG